MMLQIIHNILNGLDQNNYTTDFGKQGILNLIEVFYGVGVAGKVSKDFFQTKAHPELGWRTNGHASETFRKATIRLSSTDK